MPAGDFDYDLYLQSAGGSSTNPVDAVAIRSPQTREEAEREWIRRRTVYRMESYRWLDIERLNLFVHVDEEGKVCAVTRRIHTDIRYCVNVDAACIAAGSLSIQVDPKRSEEEGRAEEAREVWAASGMDEAVLRWATNYASQGLGWIEPVRRDDGAAVLVWHTPETVPPVWDATGTRMTRAVIAFDFFADPEVEVRTGAVRSGAKRRYVKVYTEKDVNTYIDGALVAEESGPHQLGRVPLVRVAYHADGDGSIPSWSGSGMEPALAIVDSAATQLTVVGARHASPIMLGIGLRVGSDGDVTGAGKTLGIPRDTDLKWLEPVLNGLATVLDNATARLEAIRATMPQFLFAGAGANASGEALVMLTTAFTLHIAPLRRSFYSALSTALSMAAAIKADRPWSQADDVLTVTGDEPIKGDRAALVSTLLTLVDAGLLRRADAVRALQAIDLIPEGKPEEYAAALDAEVEAGRAADMSRAKELLGKGDPAQADADQAPAQDTPDPAAAPAEAIADTALNGAQIQAAKELVLEVAAGRYPRDAAAGLLRRGYQLDDAGAEDLLGSAGRGFKPSDAPMSPAQP